MLEAKAFLQEPNKDGVSLYGHLTEVLATMLESNKIDALESLEAISLSVKGTHFSPTSLVPPPGPVLDPDDKDCAWFTSSGALLQAGAGAEADEAGDAVNPNLVEAMELFSLAGVGLSREETYRVYMSLHKLQKEKELPTIRFFGKVLGTEADYFIAEATHPASDEGEEEAQPEGQVPVEEKGSGCNSFCYYVTNDPATQWVLLPSVTPQQLVASARIRKFFTGKLDAPVRAYPPFPGTEKEYLRAQISRISAASVLCAGGKYKLEEEDSYKVVEMEEDDEDFKPLPAAAMGDPAAWKHYMMGILSIGRCTHPAVEEEEDEDAPKKGPPLEPLIPPLTAISPADWSVQLHNHMGSGVRAAIARSQRWPGACSVVVAKENKCYNVYMGFAQPALSHQFSMQPPPPVLQEPDDVFEQNDAPLDEENAPVIAAAKAALAEAVAAEAEAAAADEE